MALNDYDVFISQSPRGGRLCENQRFENLESIRMEFDQLNTWRTYCFYQGVMINEHWSDIVGKYWTGYLGWEKVLFLN